MLLQTHIADSIGFDENEYYYTWKPYTDMVVGGMSTATVNQKDGYLNFAGEIKNISNTSWASLRSKLLLKDLSGYNGVEIELRTDGRAYAFEMEYNLAWQDEKAGYLMQPVANEWTVVTIPFKNFKTVKLNKIIDDTTKQGILKRIHRFNFFVANRAIGPFSLDIRSINFY